MRLATVHPGYTVQDVVANTGFELVIPDHVPTTTPPTDWELEQLRTKVDRDGRLAATQGDGGVSVDGVAFPGEMPASLVVSTVRRRDEYRRLHCFITQEFGRPAKLW